MGAMSIPILATKLYIPPPPPKVVLRSRLIERLNEGLCVKNGYGQKLTLISAPPGFGKTTLLSEWIPGCKRMVAWLSLDEGDNDLARFLAYIVAALRTIAANIGEDALGELQNPQTPQVQTILTSLLNEIGAIPNDIIFVLDDYHVINSQAIDNALTFLIDHLPQRMHLVITTREDPDLPISRLRARGQLTELRAADLRFTPAEAAEFLNRVMGLDLSAEDIAALDKRAEGWIAGLQLAALSMKGQQDIPGFIRTFTGDNHYIVDYLVEEVLKCQPEPIRNFLIQTAILDRLNGPLCDAVTGRPGGKARLETLQRGNYFIIPLDDKRYWYRYHHLFADVLHMYLITEQPDHAVTLHRRASVWFEQQGSTADAIHHALEAEDFSRVADLIELAFPTMNRSRQEETLLGWLRALPEALVCERPVLCNLYAGVLLQTGEMEGVEEWLRAAERWLVPIPEAREQAEDPPPAMVVVDQEEFRRLPGAIAMHRAGQALMLGDVAETIKQAQRVLDLAPRDDFLRHGGAATLLGLAFWTIGDLEAARHIYPQGIMHLRRAGHLADSMGCALALADIVIAQGQLHEAMRIYEHALRFASEHGEPTLRGTADMLVGMSELYYQHNDLRAVDQCLLRAKEQGEHTGLPQNRYRWRVAMAGIRLAEGDLNGALDLLNEAERLYMRDFSPNVRPIAAMKARIWARQGRLAEALEWAQEQKLGVEDELSYLREFEYITLARILLARYRRVREPGLFPEASSLLDHLLKVAEAGGRANSFIEIRILQALIQQEQGDIHAALKPLQQALALAEVEGYVRIFVDEGAPMEQLLRETSLRKHHPDYTRKLLAAFEIGHKPGGGDETTGPTTATPSALIEPLSQRELEVLRLFQTELSGPEIAGELMVALSTVRTHTKSIYSKLSVNSRRAAVRRAVELKLI
jgi:LuxR family transcriptional regulator, maltose regulon positive regulatory protein